MPIGSAEFKSPSDTQKWDCSHHPGPQQATASRPPATVPASPGSATIPPAAVPPAAAAAADADLAALRRVLEATAQPAPAQGTPSAPPGHGAAATRHSGCGGAHRLDAGRAGTERTGADVDVSGIWTLDAAMAPAPNNTVLRALDGKGRLMLPLEVAAAARVPAERDGTVLTVFLPGAAERPRSNFAGRH